MIIDEHRQYLEDTARISAYCRAIGEVVRPGDVVLDLGAGTGIMGLLSCQAGAARVYSIDAGGMIEVARSLCRANGFADRVTFIKGLSLQVELPEKVDVVVADQIGRFGFEAGVLEYYRDARERFLKPEGRCIPARIDLFVAPVECPEMWRQVEFWNDSSTGFDLRPVRAWAVNTGYPIKYKPEHLLGAPSLGASLDTTHPTNKPFEVRAELVAARSGVLHGIGGWFEAQLSPHVTVTNSPLAADTINRRNVYFPLDHPIPLDAGDQIEVMIHVMPQDLVVTWRAEIWAAKPSSFGQRISKGQFTHSTWGGMLVAKEDLDRTRPDLVPQLTQRGQARKTVLDLCDGQHTLREVEQEVQHRHSTLFRTPSEAALFVAEVVTRYAVPPNQILPGLRANAGK